MTIQNVKTKEVRKGVADDTLDVINQNPRMKNLWVKIPDPVEPAEVTQLKRATAQKTAKSNAGQELPPQGEVSEGIAN